MSSTFPFLDLPTEIRTKIYLYLIHTPEPISLSHPTSTQLNHYPSTLLLTCLQLYAEVRPLFYFQNTFTISISRLNTYLQQWTLLYAPFRGNARLIRSLSIRIERWGTGTFFLRNLVPVVQDMILVGGLRRLEVLVKESYWRNGKKWMRIVHEESVGDGSVGEGSNWNALRTVLRDPDLEVARFGTFTNREGKNLEDGSCNVVYRDFG